MNLKDSSKSILVEITDLISKNIEQYLKVPRNFKDLTYNTSAQALTEQSEFLDLEIQSKLNEIKHSWKGSKDIKQEQHVTILNFEFRSQEHNVKRAEFFLDYACLLCYIIQGIFIMQGIKKSNRVINLNLIDYLGKKTLPLNPREPLKAKHVNSGLTTFYRFTNRADVLVYRREEMCKVLIHELIHAHDIDSKFISNSGESRLARIFCLSRLEVNEAFTDAFACLLNIILFTCFEKGEIVERLILHFENEIGFIKAQAYKVIKHTGYNKQCTHIINTDTNAMSYYVFKAIIFDNFDDYLEFLKHNKLQFNGERSMIDFAEKLIQKNVDWSSWAKYQKKNFLRCLRMSSHDFTNLVSGLKLYKDNSKI